MDRSHPQYAAYLERLRKWEGLPVTVGELEMILGAARTYEGEDIDGIPANLWWPALVLAIVNSARFTPDLLSLPLEAYHRDSGKLVIGREAIKLHAHTAHALDAMDGYEREKLFPWDKDRNKAKGDCFQMVYYHYANILHRAGLPPKQKRAMTKLRKLGERYPEVLDCIDPNRPFRPVEGFPHRKPKRKRKPKLGRNHPDFWKDEPDDGLRRYFRDVYKPLRLIGCSDRTIETYHTVITAFSTFLGCPAALGHLNDDSVDRYQAWMHSMGYAPNTINAHTRHLLALWRHAYRKRKLEELPRDVFFVRGYKRIPEAWSTQEMAKMLAAAGETEGEFRRIPAKLYWPALILTMYDTGLRLGAVMQIKSEDFNLENGILIARAETQKQRADQLFKVHQDTLEAVRAIEPEQREFLFNFPNYRNSKSWLYSAFDEILNRAGLPTTERDKFHKIRRTSATYLADAIGPEEAMKHMGHSSMDITQGYLDLAKISSRVYAADVMPRPGKEAS